MGDLFSNNIFVIFVIAAIAVISYSNFRENQRMFLLCLLTYGTAYFKIFPVHVSVALLVLATFVFLEYLSEDVKKLELFVRIRWKLLDYFYMMLFQFHLLEILASFLLLYFARSAEDEPWQSIFTAASFWVLFLGEHLTISQPFKTKSVTELIQVFERFPVYCFKHSPAMDERFKLLCAFEDDSYFERDKSYSCFSPEYMKFMVSRHGAGELLRRCLKAISPMRLAAGSLFNRGFSTPEMQLMRTLGVTRGYDRYKLKRKAFEVIYSHIFFSALKVYHQANSFLELRHYRQYLLYIYFQSVLTKIKGDRYIPLSSVFEDPENVGGWSMEGLFIACLGLSFRPADEENLNLFTHIIDRFDLKPDKIDELNAAFPERKFPS